LSEMLHLRAYLMPRDPIEQPMHRYTLITERSVEVAHTAYINAGPVRAPAERDGS